MAKKTYLAKTAITHNDTNYVEGDTIELDDKTEAPQLLAVNAVELSTKKSAAEK